MQNPIEAVMASAENFVTKVEARMAVLVKPVMDEVATLRAQIVEFGHRAVADAAIIGTLEAKIAEWEARVEVVVAPLRELGSTIEPVAPRGASMQDHAG